jgi:hypothetical protein
MKNLITYTVLMKGKKNKTNITADISLSVRMEIQCLIHPAKASPEYFLMRFQSLKLPSKQSESPRALNLLALNSHVSYKVSPQL